MGCNLMSDLTDASGKKYQLFSQYIDPKNDENDRKWLNYVIDLSAWVNQKVSVTFETQPGPNGDDQYDWAGWRQPQIVQAADFIFLDHLPAAEQTRVGINEFANRFNDH